MRRAEIRMKNRLAGWLSQDENGYHFIYDKSYLSEKADPVSLTLPLQEAPFTNKVMIPFFDGLIPEGWMLDIVQKNWKINSRDRMGLLLACCQDCIGAVSVHPINDRSE